MFEHQSGEIYHTTPDTLYDFVKIDVLVHRLGEEKKNIDDFGEHRRWGPTKITVQYALPPHG
jgi:hypothetical protein